MTVVRNIQETALAWALAEAAKSQLVVGERDVAFVAIGAGDTFGAIRHILSVVARKEIALPVPLVQMCIRWLDSYACHDEQDHLRRLMESTVIATNVRAEMPVRNESGDVCCRTTQDGTRVATGGQSVPRAPLRASEFG